LNGRGSLHDDNGGVGSKIDVYGVRCVRQPGHQPRVWMGEVNPTKNQQDTQPLLCSPEALSN
jgi:hypothetical protein